MPGRVPDLPPSAPATYATAEAVAAALLAHPETIDQDATFGSGHLDSIESVAFAEGGDWLGQVTVPGLCMLWHQGDHRYGLLMPLHLLQRHSGGDVDSMVFYLRLAVDEPHEEPAAGSRCWVLDLPSGAY